MEEKNLATATKNDAGGVMKINTSQLSMDASVERKEATKKFGQAGTVKEEGQPEFRLNLPGMLNARYEKVEENKQSQELCASSKVQCPQEEKNYETSAQQVVEKMVEGVVGLRTRIRHIDSLKNQDKLVFSEPVNPPGRQMAFSFVAHSTRYEYEKVSVTSKGSAQLADGRNIDFSLQLTMERESVVKESVAWQSAPGILMDPLVFNFDCDLRSLVNRSFLFDLNYDGENDELCSLRPGTGFLALDLNNDQKITDGRELFGPTTGHGFQELAKYDLDLNDWIDENDPIFSSLRIWRPEETRMMSLAEAGVGAICLTHDKSSFQLKNRQNRLLGEVAATGIFLTEDGEVRPMQEIKLAAHGEEDNFPGIPAQEKETDSRLFLREMIATRQAEVQALARLRLSRKEERDNNSFIETLFPQWQKERELTSVAARTEKISPG